MDTFALGSVKAVELIEDGRVDAFVKDRYSSFNSEIGKRLLKEETNLVELSDYALKMKSAGSPESGRQKYLESIVNQILFG